MGFSGLMNFVGGAARAGEQVADANLARMDAAGVAREKEAAQLRLEQRIEQADIRKEGRTNEQEARTYARGLMDDQAKLKDSRDYAIKHEQDQYDLGRARIPGKIGCALKNTIQVEITVRYAIKSGCPFLHR